MHNVSIKISSQIAERYRAGLACIFQKECVPSKIVEVMNLHKVNEIKVLFHLSCGSVLLKQSVHTFWLNTEPNCLFQDARGSLRVQKECVERA